MLYIALGFLLLGLLVGGAGMRRVGRIVGGTWRPGAGIVALAAFIAAAILAVKDAWAAAAVLALLGATLSLSVRRTKRPRHSAPAAGDPAPDVKAAASILGVAPDAGEEEVQAAYLRLIQRTHPDRGGSAGLAAQLNAARDTMLKRRG